MSNNFAADNILHRAFVFEFELHVKQSERLVKSAQGTTIERASRRSVTKGSRIDARSGTVYRMTRDRIPAVDTVENEVRTICPAAARWLSGPLRKVLDDRTTEEQLLAVRKTLLRELDPAFDVDEWDYSGLIAPVGYFARKYPDHVFEALILELCSLRGALRLHPRWVYFQCGAVRCLLAELALREPAFALIEAACARHVVKNQFPPKRRFARYVYTSRSASSSEGFPSPFIRRKDLDTLYGTRGGCLLGPDATAFISKNSRLRDVCDSPLAQEALMGRPRRSLGSSRSRFRTWKKDAKTCNGRNAYDGRT